MTDHSLRAYDSILDLLPDADNPTPIVRLHRVTGFEHARVYAKLEWYNPFGAVKDRVAANLVRDAEERGGGFLQVWLYWVGAKEGEGKHICVSNEQQNTDEWKVFDNAQSAYQAVALPYPAPASATTARLAISVNATAPGITPVIHIDDVELVEVPGGE